MSEVRFTKLISVAIETEIYDKIMKITSENGIKVSQWLRGLIYKELEDSMSIGDKSLVEDDNTNQGINENDHDHDLEERHFKRGDDIYDLNKLMSKDDDLKEEVDEAE